MRRKHWKSKRLEQHQNKLRNRALKEKNEEKRKDYWGLYFDAKDMEHEVDGMVKDAHTCRLLDIMTVHGYADSILDEEKNNPPPEEDKPNENESDEEPPDHEDDIPPRQKGFWD